MTRRRYNNTNNIIIIDTVLYIIILTIYFILSDRGVFHYINENNPSLGERFRNNMMLLYMFVKNLGITKNAIPIGFLCVIFAFVGYRYGSTALIRGEMIRKNLPKDKT